MEDTAATAEDNINNKQGGGRLLYIVTTMHMYDSGRRETKRGFDRFGQSLIPIIAETTRSLLTESSGLISHVESMRRGDSNYDGPCPIKWDWKFGKRQHH
jgi:hypothetical protein